MVPRLHRKKVNTSGCYILGQVCPNDQKWLRRVESGEMLPRKLIQKRKRDSVLVELRIVGRN